MLEKPREWVVSPAAVAPEWQWFWTAVTIPLILNEGTVFNIVNPKYPSQTWTKGGAANQDVSIGYGPQGQYLVAERAGPNLATLDSSGLVPANVNPEPQSFFLSINELGSDFFGQGSIANNTDAVALGVDGSRKPYIRKAADTRLTATGTVPATGPFSVGYVTQHLGLDEIYIDGDFDSSATDGGFGDFGNVATLFGLTGQMGRTDIQIYCFYQFNGIRLTARQFKQLHDDPFGPFRMADEPEVWAGAVAAQTITASLDAAVQAQRALSASLNAALQQPGLTQTANLDAGVAVSASQIASLDAALQAVLTANASLDAVVAAAQQAIASLDAALQETAQKTTFLDAALAVAQTAQANLDAVTQAARQFTVNLDGVLEKAKTAAVNLDAVIQATATVTTSLEAVLQKTLTVSAGLDASVIGGTIVTAALDAAVQTLFTVTLSLDAALQVSRSAEASLDAAIKILAQTTSASIDAALAVSKLRRRHQGLACACRHLHDAGDPKRIERPTAVAGSRFAAGEHGGPVRTHLGQPRRPRRHQHRPVHRRFAPGGHRRLDRHGDGGRDHGQ